MSLLFPDQENGVDLTIVSGRAGELKESTDSSYSLLLATYTYQTLNKCQICISYICNYYCPVIWPSH